ncbi:nucleoside phosphorylase [Alkalihalobacillus sp. AL-G]|uniref:nucleoside phosphorylase n=1 Tax=Alkalihalobacillus sp. AL-G TaxID=2926399 RepID=UPI00272BF842|nr:nucleoside phosphorylase [Alkalihalobacillus sp. AL-G]WLD93584.1 nucleoside phosphorylase [Alkalihalobacillus sp. AL-G]
MLQELENKWETKANRPELEDGSQYHIRCRPGDVAKYVLLPGDPDRVPMMAEHWDEKREIASYREHVTYTGKVGGVDISACSTGAGGPSTASALEELAEVGADSFIRVGTCAALQENIAPGDLIICSGAVRYDGTSDQYVDPKYPAVANQEVVMALIEAAERLGVTYHVGIGYTSASFFCGQGRPGFNNYRQGFMDQIIKDAQQAGVVNFEMEAATVLTLSSLFKLRAGAVFSVVANRIKDQFSYQKSGVEQSIAVSTEAFKILHEWDELKKKSGKPYFYPSLLTNK